MYYCIISYTEDVTTLKKCNKVNLNKWRSLANTKKANVLRIPTRQCLWEAVIFQGAQNTHTQGVHIRTCRRHWEQRVQPQRAYVCHLPLILATVGGMALLHSSLPFQLWKRNARQNHSVHYICWSCPCFLVSKENMRRYSVKVFFFKFTAVHLCILLLLGRSSLSLSL